MDLFALNKIVEQLLKLGAEEDESVCTGCFKMQWGLPCKHSIKLLIQEDKVITLDDIDKQWLLTEDIQNGLEQNLHISLSPQMSPRKVIEQQIMQQIHEELYNNQ